MSEMIVQCLVLITGERVEEEEDEDMEVVNGTWERGHRLVSATHTYPHICTYMALILCKLGQEGMRNVETCQCSIYEYCRNFKIKHL